MDDLEQGEARETQAFVEALISRGELEGPALGVAQQYVHQGRKSLSQKQQAVLDAHVLEPHLKECANGCGAIPMSEQVEAIDNGGICGYCEHRWNKVMNEE